MNKEQIAKALESLRSQAGVVIEPQDIPLFIHENWEDEEGNCQGGISSGVGFTIAWQRGSIQKSGRNGAFLIEVLSACEAQLEYYQASKFACDENAEALEKLTEAIAALDRRRERRMKEGKLGTHEA